MLHWLLSLFGRARYKNGEAEPDPISETQEFSEAEIEHVAAEARAIEAEDQMRQATKQHMETIGEYNPQIQHITEQLRTMKIDPPGQAPAQQ